MEPGKMEEVELVVEPVRMASIIDTKSMLEYKRQYEMYLEQNKIASKEELLGHLEGYIKNRIEDLVSCECCKRVMDISTVAVSTGCSMVIPFSGVAPVVAATVIQCLTFAMALGLIPLLNVRSSNDLTNLSRQVGMTIKRSSKSGLWAGIETAVIEILKELGVGDWLWTDILKDVLIEIIGQGASGAAWIVSPLLAVPKYMLHRHTIKRMYRKLGDRAMLVHTKWAEIGVTVPVLVVEAVTVLEATVLEGVQVGATPTGISAPTATTINQQPERNTPATTTNLQPQRNTLVMTTNQQPERNTPTTTTNLQPQRSAPATTTNQEPQRNTPATTTNQEPQRNTPTTTTNQQPQRNTPTTTTNLQPQRSTPATTTNQEPQRNTPTMTTNQQPQRNTPATTTNMQPQRNTPATTTNLQPQRNTPATTINMQPQRNTPATTTNLQPQRNTPATTTNQQPQRNSPAMMNPPRKTIIFGYTPPVNSSSFQPQIQGVPTNPASQPFYFQATAPKAAGEYNLNVMPTAQPMYCNFQPHGCPPPTSQPSFMSSATPVGLCFYTHGVPTYPPQFGPTMYPPPFQPKCEEETVLKQGSMNLWGVDASEITSFENYGYTKQVMGIELSLNAALNIN